MKKKQEIILSQEVVSLNEFENMVKDNIFPLCIILNDDEKEEYKKVYTHENSLPIFDLIKEFYIGGYLQSYLHLDGYSLREKIEKGEIYVNKFLDKTKKVKHVRFIAPAFGYDMDYPKIVFRKTPRLLFKKMDHFSMDSKYKGEELLGLSMDLIDEKEKELIKK